MTYYVSSGMLNPTLTHSLTHSLWSTWNLCISELHVCGMQIDGKKLILSGGTLSVGLIFCDLLFISICKYVSAKRNKQKPTVGSEARLAHANFFRWAILTHKVGQTDPVFGS